MAVITKVNGVKQRQFIDQVVILAGAQRIYIQRFMIMQFVIGCVSLIWNSVHMCFLYKRFGVALWRLKLL